MCYVSIEQLSENLDYYLEKSMQEDIYVTKDSDVISVLTNPQIYTLKKTNAFLNQLPKVEEEGMSDGDILYEEILKH